jgi:sugar/nucleoside kinase (ribokinase family)
MSERPFAILVAGELNPDAIVVGPDLTPEFGQVETLATDGTLTIGSSGAIFACGAARLGLATTYVGVVGDDAGGRFVLSELERRGVDTAACRVEEGRATGLTVVISRGEDRAILTAVGVMDALAADDVTDRVLAGVEHLHVTSPALQPRLRAGLPDLFARAHAAGLTTSLDPGWDPAGEWDAALGDALAATDVLFPNAAEACRIAGTGDPEAALDELAARVPTVVVKLGADGAIAADPRGRARAAVPALDSADHLGAGPGIGLADSAGQGSASAFPAAPVDTTGAGDSFAAGFLRAARAGLSLEERLRVAVACGSLSTTALGGVAAQPTWPEAAAAAAVTTTEGSPA